MKGLPWGTFYEKYGKAAHPEAAEEAKKLYGDPYVKSRKGIFEYLLGGKTEPKLLEVRVFDEATRRSAYEKQTAAAKEAGASNCPDCANGHEANKDKIWTLAEMDADHVTPWSKGGATSQENCQMLCRRHNQAKGNR